MRLPGFETAEWQEGTITSGLVQEWNADEGGGGERTLPPDVGDHTLLAFRSYVLSRHRSVHTVWPHVFFK